MKTINLVIRILYVIRSFVRPILGSTLTGLIIASIVILLLLVQLSHAVEINAFEGSGTCFDLSARYLRATGKPYIIDSRLQEYSCNWNFQGKTLLDFEKWCSMSGLRCGGNPYFVGFDSTWHNGEYMPVKRAEYLKQEKYRQDSVSRSSALALDLEKRKQDSLAHLPPLPSKRIVIEYLEIGKSTAERLGFSYSDYIGSAKFFSYNDLFSVTIQAKSLGDTSFTYRSYTSVYDSTLSVFWGGKRDRLTQSNITSNGVVSNNYESEEYGLNFSVQNHKYSYSHSTDYEHSINGAGLLLDGTNHIFGSYQYDYEQVSYIPFLGKIPFLGALFRHVEDVTEVRYMFIAVTIKNVSTGLYDGEN